MAEKEELIKAPKVALPKLTINRDVMRHEDLCIKTGYVPRDKRIKVALKKWLASFSCVDYLVDLFPVIKWVPKYKIKRNLLGDIIAGVTVAIMQIPQGLAYGLLAGLPASTGLYMAFFPVIVFALFATSRHLSMGTFAVISMMVLKVVQTHSDANADELSGEQKAFTPVEVATAVAFLTGLIHLLLFFLRLGVIASLLTECLVQGFTTGAAFHVIFSQLKDAFGLTIIRYKGAFKLIYTLIDFFPALKNTNLIAFGFFAGVYTFLMIWYELLRPIWSKKIIVPFPAELIAIIGGTLISKYTNMGEEYNVTLVGEIPTGLPKPVLPPFTLFPKIIIDCFAIAIVIYTVTVSMSFLFAKKHSYQIIANQELFALGLANIVGGMFSCMPIACSLSRSIIQEQTGGKTQLASLITASVILFLLLWLGPFFEPLPRCVLAAVIISAIKPLIMQLRNLKRVSKRSKLDLLTFLGTFLAVVIIDIDYGLLVGFATSLLSLYIKGWKAGSAVLGSLPGTEIYVDIKNHKDAVEIPGVKIFRYVGYINFASESSFKKKLHEAIQWRPGVIYRLGKRSGYAPLPTFKVLIVDMTTVTHLDVAATRNLSEIVNEMVKIGIKVIFSAPIDQVYHTIIDGMNFGEGPFEVYPTIHDAVLYAKAYIGDTKGTPA